MTDQTRTYAASSGSTAAEAARTTAGQAKDAVGQVADQAKDAVGQVADQARGQMASQLADQKYRAAQSLGDVAQALRTTGQQLREQDQAGITGYVDQIASNVEQFSNYIEQHDLGEIVDDVEHFARRQPALFLGGAFVLGLLGARFLKSSSAQRYQASRYPLARQEDQADLYGYDTGYQRAVGGTTGVYNTPSSGTPYSGTPYSSNPGGGREDL